MRILISILVLCIGILQGADAQTFTQRIQQKTGKATLTVGHSATIDNLVNNATLGSQNTTAPAKNEPTTAPAADSKTTANSQADEAPKTMHGSYKVTGYRVQAYAGGNSRADKLKAERIRENIKQYYPNVPVYVHFHSPRWICRVGDYRTYEEAHQMLNSLRSMGFDQATIVKGKITVSY